MGLKKIAQVVLPLPLPQVFSYEIPEEMVEKLCFGQRVLVQFGPKRIQSALVWNIVDNEGNEELKPLLSILDERPLISTHQKNLWEWMASYYLCTLGDIMKAALPAGLKLESHTRILTNETFVAENSLPEILELAWLYLRKNPGATIEDLGSALKRKNPLPIIHHLSELGAIALEEKIQSSYKPKTTVLLRLASQYAKEGKPWHNLLESLNRAPKQKNTLLAFLDKAENRELTEITLLRSLLQEDPLSSPAGISGLIKRGYLIKEDKIISRLNDLGGDGGALKELNLEQKSALKKFLTPDCLPVSLLYGITSSGKTEVYIHLIQHYLEQGKQVLYLLPEIALTEQIIIRLQAVFGTSVGVYHSKYSDSERVEIWKDILSEEGKFKIILGARSAIFLPYRNLGLIIVDEEHEPSFKQQDPAPRYHGRDTAIVLAKIHKAQVILGTATPSLESFQNARMGKYELVELKKRHKNIPLPEIILANTKEAYRKKKITGHFTPELLEAMDQALVNEQQIILFQNRRGYSPYVECHSCGHVPKCHQCDVSLTLHKYRSRMVCHYCGYAENVHDQCPACKNNALRTKGLGTEGLEDELGIIFPTAKIARLDLDAARTRNGYSSILQKFEDRKTDILIGTQMVSKGLDFSNVSVVGIVNADNLLHFPDFRSFERSFQLMTQVSGRAGRSGDQGLVVIQSFDPSHRVIQQVLQNNYLGLFQSEMKDRADFLYPPYARLIKINIKHKDQELVNRAGHYLAKVLRERWANRILGPQAPGISRIQKYYIRQILIKSAKGKEHQLIRENIREVIARMKVDKTFRAVIIQPDVDPI